MCADPVSSGALKLDDRERLKEELPDLDDPRRESVFFERPQAGLEIGVGRNDQEYRPASCRKRGTVTIESCFELHTTPASERSLSHRPCFHTVEWGIA